MAQVIPLIFGDVGSPLSKVIMATDTMGASNADAGGYGVDARALSSTNTRNILEKCHTVARTIADLSGKVGRLLDPHKELQATIPTTLLPDWLFDTALWRDVCHGRWKYEDHTTWGK